MKKWFLILTLFFTTVVEAQNQVLNIYNWADYMPAAIITQFEKETGIKVNYSEYDSNETLYAKLKSEPTPSYDIVVPSGYLVDRLRKQGMLQVLDRNQLPNFKNLNPRLLNQAFDPSNVFTAPYLWGTVGIVINSKYIPENSITSWADLWKPQYKNQILVLDDMRMTFGMALLTLGYSINETNPEHIRQAYLKLKELMPNIKLFSSDSADSLFIDNDVMIGMNFNGDTYRDIQENPDLRYIYPKEGFPVWIDNLAIPKGAPHLQNAYKFINFLLRPDIAKEIALTQQYSSPNLTAEKMMPPERRYNPILNPSAKILKRGQTQIDLDETDALYVKYWEMLKISS